MRYEQRIERAARAIADAENVLIGGGAGVSAAAGLTYSGPRFTDNFADFIAKYGVTDMYTSSFYPFETQQELWAYWARHISLNRFQTCATPLYRELLGLVKSKRHFVLTTNVDGQFAKAGFDISRIFAVQGDYGKLQCAVAVTIRCTAMSRCWIAGWRRRATAGFHQSWCPYVRCAAGRWT